MKRFIVFAGLIVLTLPSFGQISPRLNDHDILKKLRVKTIRTFYYDREDTTKATRKRLLLTREYYSSGKFVYQYLRLVLDPYSHHYIITFTYDQNNNRIERVFTEKMFSLGKDDVDYREEFVVHEKTRYHYNDENQLVKAESFHFDKEGSALDTRPNGTVIYEYAEGLLVKEIATSGGNKQPDYITTYEYNPAKQKTLESKVYSPVTHKIAATTRWTYNADGQLQEMIVEDNYRPANTRRIRYEYDAKGKLVRELKLSETNQWKSHKEYDAEGKEIWAHKDATFDFYENGLVKRELHKNKESGETVNFITYYSYYQQR